MKFVDKISLAEYRKNDWIATLLSQNEEPRDKAFASHRWLTESPAKRMIFNELYGDLLAGERRHTVLDIGGGCSALTRILARRHDYHLLDPMHHDRREDVVEFERALDNKIWIDNDWYEQEPDPEKSCDIVIANDLFPNVDSRLNIFLTKYLPVCREIRLSLTFYNRPRFYVVKRLDADEVLTVVPWDGEQTRRALMPFEPQIERKSLDALPDFLESTFPNGRQVCTVTLQGGAN